MDSNISTAREARRLLTDRIREDWEWPQTPKPASNPHIHYHPNKDADPLDAARDFKPRFYASSASELDVGSEPREHATDPYMFDSPDNVQQVLAEREDARRRKRRRAFLDEVEWNEGLACWAERRDAWTGVTHLRELRRRQRLEQQAAAGKSKDSSDLSDSVDTMHISSSSGGSRAGTGSGSSGDGGSPSAKSTLPSSIQDDDYDDDSSDDYNYDGLVPIAPPILPPTHPIRAAICPKTYPEIYEKVVVSARTPSVPINLADMTAALVQGWKANNEWPPKSRPPDPLVGRRRGAGAARQRAAPGSGQEGAFLAHHPHVKKGVESVKKVFRVSGSHSSDKSPVQV